MVKAGSFNTTQFFVNLLLIFITIQISIWILSKYTDIQFIKMGWILLLFLAVSAIVTTFVVGKKIGSLNKQDFLFIMIEFLVIVALFYYTPKYIPQIFSVQSLQISETIKESVGAIINITGQLNV